MQSETIDASNYRATRQLIFQRNVVAAKDAMPDDEYVKTFKTTKPYTYCIYFIGYLSSTNYNSFLIHKYFFIK